MLRGLMRYYIAAVLTLLTAATCFGQESRGTLSGRVTDSSGSVLRDAQVRAANTQTGATFDSRSNEAGLFSIPFLLPGTYNVAVELAGFKKLDRKGIEVRVNDNVQLDLQLSLGDVSQTVEVTAATPLLQTGESSLGQVIDTKRMTELPIASGNPAELVTLAPGTIRTTGIQINKAAFNSGTSSVTTNGNSVNSNEFSIDGVPNTFAAGPSPRIAFSAPQAAIAEFKVMTTTYDAAIGHTSGAVINTITSSGTNKFHGEVHEFLGGSFLNAPDLFANRAGQKKAVYQDNRYGGSFNGPVILPKIYNGTNKTFFSYVWEGNKWGTPQTLLSTVPTDAEKRGDLSGLLKLGSQYQIYDPNSTVALLNGQYQRSPVPGNVIPGSKLNPVALAMAKYWPNPTSAGNLDGSNNFTVATRSREDYWVNFLRIDQNFNDRNRMFVRLDWDQWFERENLWYDNPAAGIDNHRTNRGLALDEVYVLSTNTILNVRYGITQQDFPENRESQGFDLASLGFSQDLTNLTPRNLATFPNTNFGSFLGLGQIISGDGTNTGLVHSLNGSLTTQRGSHNFHYGVDARLYRAFAARYPYDISPQLTFNSAYTNGPLNTSAASPFGADLASFLYGIVPQGQMTRSASYATQEFYLGAFFHDDWKVSRKLTLNLGLRVEHESPMTERYDRSVQGFDYTTANPIQGQAAANYAKSPIPELPASAFQVLGGLRFAGGANGRDLWSQPALVLLPRFGLAYQLASKTVIRAGYGIYYDTLGTNRSPAIQTGFTASTPITASYDNGQTFAATLANPFPNGLLAPVGAAGGLTTNLGQALTVYPTDRVQPYTQRWSFGLQHQLPAGFLLDASYVGNHAIRLQVARELNASNPSYLSTTGARDQNTINFLSQTSPNPFYGLSSVYGKTITRSDLLRPYPEFGSIMETEPIGYSWYHAFQMQVVKRFSHGYTLNVAYTFSKSLDATSFLNTSDTTPWYGVSSADRPHRVVISGIWELPVGRGRAFASNIPKALDYAIGGWQLNAVISRQSGSPLTWGNIIFNGNVNDIILPKDQRSVDRWFNTGAGFNRISSQQLGSNLRTFPLRFGSIRGDGQALWNLSAIKYFPITESVRFELRGECFNALNHPNLNDPNLSPTSASFGAITAQDGFAREFQVAARIRF
jgi:hypothetical protein